MHSLSHPENIPHTFTCDYITARIIHTKQDWSILSRCCCFFAKFLHCHLNVFYNPLTSSFDESLWTIASVFRSGGKKCLSYFYPPCSLAILLWHQTRHFLPENRHSLDIFFFQRILCELERWVCGKTLVDR